MAETEANTPEAESRPLLPIFAVVGVAERGVWPRRHAWGELQRLPTKHKGPSVGNRHAVHDGQPGNPGNIRRSRA